jgi:uncharacterized protein YciI
MAHLKSLACIVVPVNLLLPASALLPMQEAVPIPRRQESVQAKEEPATYYWGFFVRGPNQEKLPEDEAERLQKGHIANLERLHAEGKLLMAGPLGEAGRLRGIVVLNVPSLDDVKACFKDDPFVKIGRMEMEAYKWFTTRGDIKEPRVPVKMEEYRIGLLKKGPSWSSEQSVVCCWREWAGHWESCWVSLEHRFFRSWAAITSRRLASFNWIGTFWRSRSLSLC